MQYQLDDKILSKKDNNYTHIRQNILPFQTRNPERATFENDFSPITAEFIRDILKLSTPEIHKTEKIINSSIDRIDFNTEQDKETMNMYLNGLLHHSNKKGDLTNIKNFPLSEGRSKVGEVEIAHFLYDFFIRAQRSEIDEIVADLKDNKNILTNLIDSVSSEEEVETSEIKAKYKGYYSDFSKLFLKDFKFVLRNRSAIINNLNLLLSHYYFVVSTQLIIGLDNMTNFDSEKFTKVVYILMTEKSSRSRDSYIFGLHEIKRKLKRTITHDHIFYILNNNTFRKKAAENDYWDYSQFKDFFAQNDKDVELEFVKSIVVWMENIYCRKNNIDFDDKYYEIESFAGAVEMMHELIQYAWYTYRNDRSKPDGLYSRFMINYDEIQRSFFRKNGGSLGQLIALSQNHLLFLVGMSVGDEPLLVSDLWLELEKRGVWFDHKSKTEVVKILTKLNYIDKKSDSGDAQYVKRIL